MNEARSKAKARVVDPVSVKQINGLKKLFENMDGVDVEVTVDAFRDCFMVNITAGHPIVLNKEQIEVLYPLLEYSTRLWVGYDDIMETHGIEVEFPHYVYEW